MVSHRRDAAPLTMFPPTTRSSLHTDMNTTLTPNHYHPYGGTTTQRIHADPHAQNETPLCCTPPPERPHWAGRVARKTARKEVAEKARRTSSHLASPYLLTDDTMP
mmetsp:Transcript_13939/g.35048  ORF Transcript_13939/g.35048 Transcript_13939/m.35048 type:complete len:106 (+) Transcript_13939:98-415(+)